VIAPGLPKGFVLDRARLIVCGLLAEVPVDNRRRLIQINIAASCRA
jgi:hypothetical protein